MGWGSGQRWIGHCITGSSWENRNYIDYFNEVPIKGNWWHILGVKELERPFRGKTEITELIIVGSSAPWGWGNTGKNLRARRGASSSGFQYLSRKHHSVATQGTGGGASRSWGPDAWERNTVQLLLVPLQGTRRWVLEFENKLEAGGNRFWGGHVPSLGHYFQEHQATQESESLLIHHFPVSPTGAPSGRS